MLDQLKHGKIGKYFPSYRTGPKILFKILMIRTYLDQISANLNVNECINDLRSGDSLLSVNK